MATVDSNPTSAPSQIKTPPPTLNSTIRDSDPTSVIDPVRTTPSTLGVGATSEEKKNSINHSPVELPPISMRDDSILSQRTPGSSLTSVDSVHSLHLVGSERRTMSGTGSMNSVGEGSPLISPTVEQTPPSLAVGDLPTVAEVGKVIVGTGGPASGTFPQRHHHPQPKPTSDENPSELSA